MHGRRLGSALSVAVGIAQFACAVRAEPPVQARVLPHVRMGVLGLKTVREPSGVCYHSTDDSHHASF